MLLNVTVKCFTHFLNKWKVLVARANVRMLTKENKTSQAQKETFNKDFIDIQQTTNMSHSSRILWLFAVKEEKSVALMCLDQWKEHGRRWLASASTLKRSQLRVWPILLNKTTNASDWSRNRRRRRDCSIYRPDRKKGFKAALAWHGYEPLASQEDKNKVSTPRRRSGNDSRRHRAASCWRTNGPAAQIKGLASRVPAFP